jgi:hypothetical protein
LQQVVAGADPPFPRRRFHVPLEILQRLQLLAGDQRQILAGRGEPDRLAGLFRQCRPEEGRQLTQVVTVPALPAAVPAGRPDQAACLAQLHQGMQAFEGKSFLLEKLGVHAVYA